MKSLSDNLNSVVERVSTTVAPVAVSLTPLTATYRLEGVAARLWWQIPSGKAKASCSNLALQQLASTLVMLPVWAVSGWIYRQSHVTALTEIQFAVMAVVPWLCVLAVFLMIGRRHLQHVSEVRVSNQHLELCSGFRSRRVTWSLIEDLYPVAYFDNERVDAFMLELRTGEQFVLSTQLANAEELFEIIKGRMTGSEPIFQNSYRADDSFFDCAMIASFVAFLACGVGLFNDFDFVNFDPGTAAFVFSVLALATASAWIHATKIPQIIRTGDAGIFLQTRSDKFFLRRDEITRIRNFAGWHLVSANQGWFLTTFQDFGTNHEPCF